MIIRWRFKKFILVNFVVSLLLLFTACAEGYSQESAWIDFPRDGSVIALGDSSDVISHAFTAGGATEAVLSVNGDAYRLDPPINPGDNFSEFTQEWAPTSGGFHTLQVIAYNGAGEAIRSELVTVNVVSEIAAISPTIELAPAAGLPDLSIVDIEALTMDFTEEVPLCNIRVIYTNSGESEIPREFAIQFSLDGTPFETSIFTGGLPPGASAELVFVNQFEGLHDIGIDLDIDNVITESNEENNSYAASLTCEIEAQDEIPPPTETTPPIIEFWAEPASIQAGECVVIHWHAENVRSITFGGVEQQPDGSFEDCLCSDQFYTLTVVHLDNSQEERRVDISVSGTCDTPTPPPPTITATAPEPTLTPTLSDSTPPPIPEPSVPADNLDLSCRATQNLVWLPVSDPSGLGGYFVQLERRPSMNDVWNPVDSWGPVLDNQHTVDVECGYYYRWRVQAQDGVGNYSAWSNWSHFAILLN